MSAAMRMANGALVFLLGCAIAAGQPAAPPSLRGVVTDPAGAVVPSALIQLRGPGPEVRSYSGVDGTYSVTGLRPGTYQVRVIAKGFAVTERNDYSIAGPSVLDARLEIESTREVVNVEEEAARVNVDPLLNAGALVLGARELAALSDDPDVLLQQLQAMAGPGAGPSGGQIYIDGFTGGNLPPKASIREVRINSNPFSSEYERPGFGRIEIFTKPGTDFIRGQAFFQFNNQYLNSRSPLLAQSTRPPYEQKFFGINLSGPVRREKASFGLDFERRAITENAFIYATTLDQNLNAQTVNRAVETPQTRTSFSPRLDYAFNSKATLVGRYQLTRLDTPKEGIGSYALESQAYGQLNQEHTVQMTETQIVSPRLISETRFQWMRTAISRTGDNSTPAINVVGAFQNGGAQIGFSGSRRNRWEISNTSTFTQGVHTWKWGGRLRLSYLDDTSVNNFGGTYTFFGGQGPALDASGQPIAGTSESLSSLERYRRTLLFLQQGLSATQIRQLGGGASQFSLTAGTPTASVNQTDIGVFLNDDWRLNPRLTLSYGVRYEAQSNRGDFANLAPRMGLAWAIGSRNATVIRLGAGSFFDRISADVTLQVLRFNGATQQSYLITNPDFYPQIPTAAALASAKQPQTIRLADSTLRNGRTYQLSASVERQVNSHTRLSATYVESRGTNLLRSRNINAPINGVYPFGDAQLRMLSEGTGFSRSHQLTISPNFNYRNIILFGFYSLSYGKANNEGQPADPYNLRAEWGPSSFADIRHRFVVGSNVPLPFKFSVNPFIMVTAGSPFNITTGRDTNRDGSASERPSLVTGVGAGDCQGADLIYTAAYGCFNLNPVPGTEISRNYGRGPLTASVNLRLSRTWSLGGRGESGPRDDGAPPPGLGGVRGGGPPGGGGPGGGGPPGGGPPPGAGPGGPGGPPPGAFGSATGRRYNVSLSLQVQNALNHSNYAAPGGDLSSQFFGQYRSLGGFGPGGAASTYNRKLDVQLRFTF